ncbi:hypothetical protein SAMN05443429_10240 [Cruoricaptor ignavus]|uniref:Uncharacterized protein n=1 Tax=Cruoricaptor ignavus TaxID=1118202 RepID=A0A1M6BKR5_9FLAO|nr:hypothetical protein [Cruoricaptor ignavus]QOR74197.1 hypothetical protein IMZ16_01770 [Cruoricaptor ignavus]SHI49266.1 hypothetical protein SAMN05443429_10240 [Cruoricaptor ignavus]
MKDFNFTERHYEKMVELDEKFREIPQEKLKAMIAEGGELVAKNGGFANIDPCSTFDEMLNIGAFIEFRTAKKLLGEFVKEIDH